MRLKIEKTLESLANYIVVSCFLFVFSVLIFRAFSGIDKEIEYVMNQFLAVSLLPMIPNVLLVFCQSRNYIPKVCAIACVLYNVVNVTYILTNYIDDISYINIIGFISLFVCILSFMYIIKNNKWIHKNCYI